MAISQRNELRKLFTLKDISKKRNPSVFVLNGKGAAHEVSKVDYELYKKDRDFELITEEEYRDIRGLPSKTKKVTVQKKKAKK